MCFNTSLQANAPAKFIFNISCVLLLLSMLMYIFRYHKVEQVLLAIAAPCAWFKLLFFARYVCRSIRTVQCLLSSSF